jgi:predicted metal-binding protein
VPWKQAKIVVDDKVRGLCPRPYPGHPRGCPNYGCKEGCPPEAPRFSEVFDLRHPLYVVWTVFDLWTHVAAMKERHPRWTPRQLRCCLYWQPRARKLLAREIALFRGEGQPGYGMSVSVCPEAMGVNVSATMKGAGETLEWPPEQRAYTVAVAGHRNWAWPVATEEGVWR